MQMPGLIHQGSSDALPVELGIHKKSLHLIPGEDAIKPTTTPPTDHPTEQP